MKGIITALVTPFYKGEVDIQSLKALVRKQLDQGVDGLVVNGTTGESPTLSWEEVHQIFATVKTEVANQVPLILGTGTNSTAESIAMTKQASEWGAKACLVVVPYYNKPPQRGLVAHFSAIAESSPRPIILYNVPGRTITSLSLEAIRELSSHPAVLGIKEASGDMSFGESIIKNCRSNFVVLSGDDPSFLDLATRGARGVISVISNLFVSELKALLERAQLGDAEAHKEFTKKYSELLTLLYIESNPIPVKMALYKMGVIRSPEMRMPLVEFSSEYQPSLERALRKVGLI